VAAALGVGPEVISYEGQAAIELETLAGLAWERGAGERVGQGYALELAPAPPEAAEGLIIDPSPMWVALFDDLSRGVAPALIAARFHRGLVRILVDVAAETAARAGLRSVALSGGVLQNRLLLEGIAEGLRARDLAPLAHHQVPANDGGLSLGQAAVSAARALQEDSTAGSPEAPKRSSR
jgi:hydrogenase maturation protein HypF